MNLVLAVVVRNTNVVAESDMRKFITKPVRSCNFSKRHIYCDISQNDFYKQSDRISLFLWRFNFNHKSYFKCIHNVKDYELNVNNLVIFTEGSVFHRVYIVEHGRLRPAKLKHFKKYIKVE